ncbi:MAG: hypothetical protein ACPGYX_10665, partial [Oceanobacter sp.]
IAGDAKQSIALVSPQHFGNNETSMLNTRFRRCALVMAWWRCSGVLYSFSCRVQPLLALHGHHIPELRVIPLNDLVEKRLFRPMTLVRWAV